MNSAKLQKLNETLAEVAARKKGWDSYDADPVSPEAVEAARKFLKDFSVHLPIPELGSSSTGEVSLAWRNNGRIIEILFQDKGISFSEGREDGTGPETEVEAPASEIDLILRQAEFHLNRWQIPTDA